MPAGNSPSLSADPLELFHSQHSSPFADANELRRKQAVIGILERERVFEEGALTASVLDGAVFVL